MTEHKKQDGFLKKTGKWGPIIGVIWIGVNIFVPLALLRIPAIKEYLIALKDSLPFPIPGVG